MAAIASRLEVASPSVPAARPVPATPRLVWLSAGSVVLTLVFANVLILLLEPYFLNVLRYDQQYTPARVIEYLQAPAPDVLFMGTSRALAGFNPITAEEEIEALTGQK